MEIDQLYEGNGSVITYVVTYNVVEQKMLFFEFFRVKSRSKE